ncbi:MAG: cysteine--tRNA ligase [Candidatus Latescibacteria bacterium]|nr:cysteine--tRNA ligase [Candidatus Latescibacterota bacterium]
MKVYNTFTRKKEDFVPLHDNRVNFYSCGPTVYDYFHIGNARPLIMFDVFRRYLEYSGYEVNYIVNITDIDDKIINRAIEEGVDFKDITCKYTDAFYEDCEKLGIRPATVHPRATEFIDDMQKLILRLLENGHAYEIDGDVYFDIKSFNGYGKLSGRDIEQMQAGARVDVNDQKKNPFDFALWKAAKPGEPSWDSPWGQGRPGWHIECSVMAMHYAGDTLDIHAGGQDLIFPHHENEIAQSEAATGKPFTKYWLHNGFLDIEGKKMSKSLGNFLIINDILKKYESAAIRVFFLLKHYRSPIDFSEERIQEAKAALDRLRNAYAKITRVIKKSEKAPSDNPANLTATEVIHLKQNKTAIIESMNDDFNTAKAMGHLFDIAKIVNSIDENAETSLVILQEAKEILDTLGSDVFGIVFESTAQTDSMVDELVQLLIELRAKARKEKNWELSDLIRNRLKEIGITFEDRQDGTTWKFG